MSKRNIGTAFIIITCLILFEVFSFSSSYKALFMILNKVTWASMLAFAFCAVDFAGLAKLFMPEMRDVPDMSKTFLLIAWALSAFGDTALTWFVVANQTTTLSGHILVQRGILSALFFTTWLPLGVAVLTWGVQVTLVVGLGKIVDSMSSFLPVSNSRTRRMNA